MNASRLDLDGLVLLEPRIFRDDRGWFFESFNHSAFANVTGVTTEFVQDNQSLSRRHVVRGLHYQVGPSAQGKLVRVVSGAIYDVVVDIRRSSASFGKWIGVELSAENSYQLWVPVGFAHGFQALTDDTIVNYKTTSYWAPRAERAIRWNDAQVGIDWPEPLRAVLSSKDAEAPALASVSGEDLF